MRKNLTWKLALIVATVLLCVYGMVGLPKSRKELLANWENNIRLGLDLKGGSLLVLQVQVQDAFKAEVVSQMERLKEEMGKQAITFASTETYDPKSIEDAENAAIIIKGVPPEKTGQFRSLVSEQLPSYVLRPLNATDYEIKMRPEAVKPMKDETVTRAMTTIENRINGLGLAEASVQARGGSDTEAEILVSLPGLDDPGRVKSIIQTAALLELYKVVDGPYPSQENALSQKGGVLPLGTKLVRSVARAGQPEGEGWYLLERTPVITGRDLRDSKPAQDQFGKWETSFVLSQEAKGRFGRFTEANVNNRLAIVLDNQVKSAPVIQSRIEDQGRITGAYSQQDASDLALVLRAGSLPAGIVYLQEQTVGPSLGADSIRQGLLAGLIGLIVVIVIMLAYYRVSGINAVIALVLNAVMLIGVLAFAKAVLTLPGIAGIILLIGMAVDSNVLIFERIREELRAGKAPNAAIDTGFNKAFITIIDTHVATVVSCAFLFMFGTPAVRGFAVTLVIGLIVNVFTSVFVSRFIYDWTRAAKPATAPVSI